jgi:phenylacetate-coenzyme A ligase PaaK-like adenylate-forming protein
MRVDPYRKLYALYLTKKTYDEAWCLAAALAFLRQAGEEEKQFFDDYKPQGLPAVRGRVDNTAWTKYLIHEDEDQTVGKIFEALAPSALRAKIEGAYGAKLFDHGAGVGISSDYPEYLGMHFVADDFVLYELVDPVTHEPIPLEDGARGLAVMTTLEGEGLLWVRETFGDIHEVSTGPSPDGLTGVRYKVVGRTDDMLKVKGVIVYPAAIDAVVARFIPRVTGEFRIVLDAPPPRVVPPLKLKIERGEHVDDGQLPALAAEMEEKMHRALNVRPAIKWLEPGALERAALKTNFFERAYEHATAGGR